MRVALSTKAWQHLVVSPPVAVRGDLPAGAHHGLGGLRVALQRHAHSVHWSYTSRIRREREGRTRYNDRFFTHLPVTGMSRSVNMRYRRQKPAREPYSYSDCVQRTCQEGACERLYSSRLPPCCGVARQSTERRPQFPTAGAVAEGDHAPTSAKTHQPRHKHQCYAIMRTSDAVSPWRMQRSPPSS